MHSRQEPVASISRTEVTLKEVTIASKDDTALFLRRWQPHSAPVVADVLIVHGYAEHGGRYRELAHALAGHGIATAALDLRGHGRSEGRRGYVAHFDSYLDDVDAALRAMETLWNIQTPFMLGHSNGGLIVLDHASQRKPSLRGVIVTNPFIQLAMPIPFVKRMVAEIAGTIMPTMSLPSGLNPEDISHDSAIVDAYQRDILIFKTANAGWFHASRKRQEEIRALRSLSYPLLYIYSNEDKLASPQANQTLAEQLASPDKTIWLRSGERHEVLNELARAPLHQDIAAWITAHRKH